MSDGDRGTAPPPLDLDPPVEVDTSGSLGLSLLELAPRADALIDISSSVSSSASDWAALNDSALRKRPLSPPLRSMLAVGVGSSIGSLSSRDILFSDAVKLPCESGEGRAGRGSGVEIGAGEILDDEEVVAADEGGESAEDRVVAVAVDVDDDVEEFR